MRAPVGRALANSAAVAAARTVRAAMACPAITKAKQIISHFVCHRSEATEVGAAMKRRALPPRQPVRKIKFSPRSPGFVRVTWASRPRGLSVTGTPATFSEWEGHRK